MRGSRGGGVRVSRERSLREVVAVNETLEAAPATVNQDAEGAGWFVKLKLTDTKELDDLMSAHDYQLYLETIA